MTRPEKGKGGKMRHEEIMAQIEINKKIFLGSRKLCGLNPFWWGIQGPGGSMERVECWANIFEFLLVCVVVIVITVVIFEWIFL